MKEARLVVHASSISFRSTSPATGDVVLLVDGSPFPMAGWNDFVVVIVGSWISSLLRIVQNTSEIERVYFMEGPYAVDIGPLEDGVIRIRAIERPNREHTLIDVLFRPLVESAVSAADQVLMVCGGAGHKSRDSEKLRSALDGLKIELSHADASR
jgi:hypothetical protein